MAVSVAVTSTQITVDGTGTLDQVYNAVVAINAAAMSKTDAVYAVNGNRLLVIDTDADITIEAGNTLQWNLTANVLPVLRIEKDGTLRANGPCTVDADTDNSHGAYFGIYGRTLFTGTLGNEVNLKHWRVIYFYDNEVGDPSNWQHVIVSDVQIASTYGILDFMGSCPRPHVFSYVTLTDTTGRNYGRAFYVEHSNLAATTFDHITVSNMYAGWYLQNGLLKFSNSTFSSCKYESPIYGTYSHSISNTAANRGTLPIRLNQPKVVFDTCTFNDMGWNYSNGYMFYSNYGGTVLIKDCDMHGDPVTSSTYGYMVYNGGMMLYYGNNTFENISSNRLWGYSGGMHYNVQQVNLTIVDEQDNPIDNAAVRIFQKLGYEDWIFWTDTNGQVKDPFGYGIFLVKEELLGATTSLLWSDGSTSNHKHCIMVSKPGYQTYITEVAITQDITKTITLKPILGVRSF